MRSETEFDFSIEANPENGRRLNLPTAAQENENVETDESLKVLHLEDNDHDAELIRMALLADGISHVTRAHTRETFLQALDADRWTLILADYSLPNFNGVSALRAAVEKRLEAPFIFVSGALGEEVAVETLKMGATDYVRKDRLQRLVPVVRRALREADERNKRRQAECAREAAQAELESNRAQMIASERLSALGMMAGAISHEINNPLTIIRALASDLAEMAHAGQAPVDAVFKNSSRIRQTSDRIVRIVNSLRTIARDGSDDLMTPASITKMVEEATDLCRERFNAKGVALLTPKLDEDLYPRCREVQVAQVLLNLLQNALDAVLEQEEGERWVRLEIESSDSLLRLSVVDSGKGVPENIKARIMEPFFTTKAVGKGTGLGLSISKAIAEEHGGRLELSDKDGHTCFSLFLPYHGKLLERAKEPTVLLVDDEEILCELMAGWLASVGARVLQARNGAEALEVAAQNPIDLLVSDIHMPVMDGVSLLKKIKASGRYIPSVIFAARTESLAPRIACDLGVEDIVEKPFDRQDLTEKVQRVLAPRAELWGLSPAPASATVLSADFEGLASAVREGAIAFGRGGFCLHTKLALTEGPVELALNFKADQRTVFGQGVVRWVARDEDTAGVEIIYLDAKSREWISMLAEQNASLSFIPPTTGLPTIEEQQIA